MFYGSNATSDFCAAIFHIHKVVGAEFLNHIYRGCDCSKHHDTRSGVFLKRKKASMSWCSCSACEKPKTET